MLAENDSQAIFRLKESGVSHLYRDFSGGVHKSNKEEKNKQENSDNGEKSDDNVQKMTKSEQELRKEVSDKEGELLEVNTGTLQVISEKTEPTTQGEITSSGAEQSERLADRVSSSDIELDDEDFQIDGVEFTDDASSSKSKASATDLDPITEATLDTITKDYGYYSYQFGECNGLVYDTHNYLGIWVEFSDDVETTASGAVGGAICFIALKKLTIPAKWLGIANVSCGALLAVPTSELVDRKYTGGFWDAHGLQWGDEKVKYGYGYSIGKYVLPRAYEDFDIPGVHTEAVDYI